MRIKIFLSTIIATAVLFACNKKDDFNYPDGTVGISRITYFPTFTMNGDPYMSLLVGQTYTEAGATAKEGTADLQVQTTGTVDVNTVGVYTITYSAVNKDGYAASVTRTIAVLPVAEQPGVNIAGSYKYNTSAVVSTITKLAPGFYMSDNVYGPNEIPAYIFTSNGVNWTLPEFALSGYGPVRGTATLNGTALQYKVDLLNYGIVGSLRNWTKQ